ncbi:transposase IS204/IS1001/IS1096/IS1165 family protein [Humibacillus xanthopallidus]|uniref:Transposase IS204/IS1001/IS1096/IS1165 family protein n=1 Tax=Humibacillus xanthopallidus TaxID=412689 RepID=A0A543PQC5_9MICO|nr:transposase IS204/IS1001/IS1096/IS1165 family protein [Humibacillus xanthopallidus]
MSDATFATPDLSKFCRLDELALEVVGQQVGPDRAVLACRVVEADEWCRRCGCQGRVRDSVSRRLAHEPFGWRPTTLLVTVRRYRCTGCGHVWRQDTSRAAQPRAKISRAGLRWALVGLVVQHLARVAAQVLPARHLRLAVDGNRFKGAASVSVIRYRYRGYRIPTPWTPTATTG